MRVIIAGSRDFSDYQLLSDTINNLFPKMDIEIVARLTLKNVAKMTKAEKLTVANWLREQAKGLLKDGDNYSKCFGARHYATAR